MNNQVTVITSKKKLFNLNFGETFKYRDLIWLFVKKSFTSRFKQTVLGPLWLIISPLLTTVVFTVVFGNIANLPTDGAPKFLFYMCGNLIWNYFASCFNSSVGIFATNAKLYSKVYFPRLVTHFSNTIINFFTALIQFAIFLPFQIYYIANGAISPNFKLLPLAILLVLQVSMLGIGLGSIISSVTTKYKDLLMLVSFGLQLWLYATPIAYSTELVEKHIPNLYTLYMLNPVTPVVESFRYIFLGCGFLPIKYLAISFAVSLAFFIIGIAVFNRTEKTFMDTI